MLRRVDASDRPGDEDLAAEPAGLLERSARQLVAGDTRGEAEVVLDPGGRAGLPARRLALDRDRPEPLGRAVHRRCQAGGARADDHRVVLSGRRLGRDVQQLGHLSKLRPHGGLAVHGANGGKITVHRQRIRPLLRMSGHVRLEPSEPDLVAVEEAPQLRTGSVPPMAEDDRPKRGRGGRTSLQTLGAPQPVVREVAHPLRDHRCGGDEGLVIVQLDPEHACRLRCAEPAGVEHPERDRHLPEDVTGPPLADHALHAVDAPDHLEPTFEHAEQRPPVTLVHGRLARRERDVRHEPGKPVTFGRLEVRENRDPADLLRRHHELHHGRGPGGVLSSIAGAPETTKRCSRPVQLNAGTR